LAQAYNSLANRLRSGGPPAEIEQAYRDAVAIFRLLVDEFPNVAKYRLDMAICLTNWAAFIQESRQPSEAEGKYQDALHLVKRLADDYPTMQEYKATLATVQSNLGNLMRVTDRLPEAETYWNDALVIRKMLVAKPQASPASHNALAKTLCQLGFLRRDQGQYRASCTLLEQAVPHHEAALKAAPRDPTYRALYRENRHNMADNFLKLGDHAAAAVATEQFLQIGNDPPNDSYVAARFLAQCANLAAKDGKLAQSEREQQSRNYANRAIELLRAAVDTGFGDVNHLRKDEELDVLRARKDFEELLDQVEAKANPEAK
jgi:tetratricopeptide (TPR) repeat protein